MLYHVMLQRVILIIDFNLFHDTLFPIQRIWDKNLVNPVPADALAPDDARSSAGTVLTEKSDFSLLKVLLTINDFLIFSYHRILPKMAAEILNAILRDDITYAVNNIRN